MKKRSMIILILVLGILSKPAPPEVREKALKAFDDIEVPGPANREAVRLGERLLFEVGYGLVSAGYGELSIPTIIEYEERLCYLIQSRAWTNRAFDIIFPVKDMFTSIWDAESLYSYRTEKHLSEGKYRANRWTKFDQKNHRAITDKYDLETYPRVQDVLSSFYYARTLNLGVGDSIPLPNHTDGRNYPILVITHERERVTVPAGTFDCLIVEPILKTPGLFDQKGRIKIWVTDDKIKMPVKMETEIMIGKIHAELIEYDEGEIWEP